MNEKNIKTYKEYENLFYSELVFNVRELLEKTEENEFSDFEDSKEHNSLKNYFNKYFLHKKLSHEEFEKLMGSR